MPDLRLSGTILDVEPVAGSNTDRQTGEVSSYAYTRLHVLAGREVNRVKIDPTLFRGQIPAKGDEVDLLVRVSAFAGRQGAALSISALSYADAAASI